VLASVGSPDEQTGPQWNPGRCRSSLIMDEADTIHADVDDATLVSAHQRGESWAFRQIFNRHQGWVFDLCYQMVRSRNEAADLTQEVFLRVHRSLATIWPSARRVRRN
jgi:hypothetical protein